MGLQIDILKEIVEVQKSTRISERPLKAKEKAAIADAL